MYRATRARLLTSHFLVFARPEICIEDTGFTDYARHVRTYGRTHTNRIDEHALCLNKVFLTQDRSEMFIRDAINTAWDAEYMKYYPEV